MAAVREADPTIAIKPVNTKGSAENVPLLEAGKLDLALVQGEAAYEAQGGAHHMGTTRMSETARNGVVDTETRVHGIENLFIAGSSIFPTSGFANPTFTLMALALRTAGHLKSTI